ncbi:MAG: hypothetical protein ABIK66_05015, partial [candidate division WOR-3 bacterium]
MLNIFLFIFSYFYPTNSLIYPSLDYLKISGFSFNYFYSKLIYEDFFEDIYSQIEKEYYEKKNLPKIIRRSFLLLKEEKERNFSFPPISFTLPLKE